MANQTRERKQIYIDEQIKRMDRQSLIEIGKIFMADANTKKNCIEKTGNLYIPCKDVSDTTLDEVVKYINKNM